MKDENNNNINKPGSGGYGASSIQQEDGAKKHRNRVSRFLGASDTKGIENQLFEIIDNSVDEIIDYYSREDLEGVTFNPKITIQIKNDWEVVVEDFGRGIPCELHPKFGIPAVYMVCESDSAGGKDRETDGYTTTTAGTHGAGMAVAKSVTEYFKLEINSLSADGKYYLEYKEGERVGELKRLGDLDIDSNGNKITGTKITYKYDPTIFSMTSNGRSVEQPYFKHLIVKRLEYMLLGSKAKIEIEFTFLDDEMLLISPSIFTPEKFLQDSELITVEIGEDAGMKSNYSASVHLSLMTSRLSGTHKTIVNRLDTQTAPSNDGIIDVVIDLLNEALEKDTRLDKKYKGSKVQRNLLKSKLSTLTVLSLKNAEYGGQTKQNLVSSRFLIDFKIHLESELRKSEDFIRKIYYPMREVIIQETMMAVEKKKVEEKVKKMRELQEEKKKGDNLVSQLKTDALARAKNKTKSRITIKDSPFPIKDSTLVYVEGKSAGAEFNDLHEEKEIPIAVALIEGKMPNVMGEETMSQITIDNRVYCLEVGYKDIAILVDGDVDGNHIRILLSYQIWKYARHYLKEGKVFIVPAPYSKLRIRVPLALELYGETKAYPAGYVYTYSAKEHQSLVSAGANFIKKYKGLADSDLSPTEALKDRSGWIRINPVIEEDIRLIEKVLEDKSDFKSIFMAEVYSGRQFFSKKVSNGKREIELDSKEIGKLLNENYLSTTPEVMNYSDMIDKNYLKQFDYI